MEDLSGRSFGPYRIVGPLGAGGMAAVYKAYQPAVDRHVALKVLPRHFAQDREFLKRFEQEATILAGLQHPHILPVHDYGDSDGFTFIVMPFIKTGTLADAIDEHPLPLEQITRVITQVGDALDYAHARGLVHRDVKPSNILIDERGNCLLADFGIAKILEGADKLTATGGLIGTPKYMSPEQGMGQAVDGRSDLYSLGVVLYEMATGRVPYEAETPIAVVIKHIRDPLPLPRAINPDMPEALERVILRSIHKEPAERFGSAAAMVEAIKPLATTKTPDTRDATTLQARLPPLPAGGVSRVSPPDAAAKVAVPTDHATSRRRGRTGALAAAAVIFLLLLWWRLPGPDRGAHDTRVPLASLGVERPGSMAKPVDPARPVATTPESPPGAAPAGRTAGSQGQASVATSSAAAARADNTNESAGVQDGLAGTATTAPAIVPALVSDGPPAVRENPLMARSLPLDGSGRPTEAGGAESGRAPISSAANTDDPFPDLGDGTFLDRQIGMRWTATGNPRQGTDGLLWSAANSYCEGLALGGTASWRLPTQLELDSVLQRLDPTRYPWGVTLWSSDREFGESNRLWVTNSPLYAPAWSSGVRDASARRLTHRVVCVTPDLP
jgi:tRNA A-37 threonylcarbamoyl transferase component Bud32